MATLILTKGKTATAKLENKVIRYNWVLEASPGSCQRTSEAYPGEPAQKPDNE